MILPKIDIVGVAIQEAECEAPRTIDMYSVADWIESPEAMKIKARHIHIFRSHGQIQSLQPTQNAGMQTRVNLRSAASSPKVRKSLAFERGDHV